MNKKLFFLFTMVIVILFFSCNRKTIDSEKEITLVMAEVNPADTVVGRMDSAFKEKVEELSDGKIKIDLQFSGILGDEKQVMSLIMNKDSSIQLTRGPANLASYSDLKLKSSLISVPYTFKNDEHFWQFANSELAEEILDEPYKLGLGVKGLFYCEEGLRHYFSTTKIESVDDLKGKKMRISGGVLTALSESFNSEGVKVNFTDLYASLQMGKVEVAEQPISNYLSNSFYQVAPFLILDGHILGAVSVMINAECWDSLSQNQKNILIEAGKYAQDFCKKIVNETNQLATDILRADGVKITEVTDKKPWQEACAEMRKELVAVDPILYQKILELSN